MSFMCRNEVPWGWLAIIISLMLVLIGVIRECHICYALVRPPTPHAREREKPR